MSLVSFPIAGRVLYARRKRTIISKERSYRDAVSQLPVFHVHLV